MRILALDLGAKRIGLAISDAESQLAFPAGVHERGGNQHDLTALAELARERGVERIVVGLPLHMNGRSGPEAEAARRFAESLHLLTGLPVDLLDERWTTREAERTLRELGRRPSQHRGDVDATAAALLLHTYLERRVREERRKAR